MARAFIKPSLWKRKTRAICAKTFLRRLGKGAVRRQLAGGAKGEKDAAQGRRGPSKSARFRIKDAFFTRYFIIKRKRRRGNARSPSKGRGLCRRQSRRKRKRFQKRYLCSGDRVVERERLGNRQKEGSRRRRILSRKRILCKRHAVEYRRGIV